MLCIFGLTLRHVVCLDATDRNNMKPQRMASLGLAVAGTTYLLASQVAELIGVSRTTLWRWRREGKIPVGRRYRNGLILFSPPEVELVQAYADKLEPIGAKATMPSNEPGASRGRE